MTYIIWLVYIPTAFLVGMFIGYCIGSPPAPPKKKMRLADAHKPHELRTWNNSTYFVPHVGDVVRLVRKDGYKPGGNVEFIVESFDYTVSKVKSNNTAVLKELDLNEPDGSFILYTDLWCITCPQVEDVSITPEEIAKGDRLVTTEELGKFVDGMK